MEIGRTINNNKNDENIGQIEFNIIAFIDWASGLKTKRIAGRETHTYARNTNNFWDFEDKPLWYDRHEYPISK